MDAAGDLLNAALLGIIEGLTEFLPVSSTGHMILAIPLLGVDKSAPTWRTLLWVSQFGAILAVVVHFRRDLVRRIFRPARAAWSDHILAKLAAAMAPTLVLALLLHDYAERYLENPLGVAAGLIVGAVAIALVDRYCRRERDMQLDDVTLGQAAAIGAIQCLSMWSGISRSAASIMGGMALGLTPRVAAEFSFYLAIPTMLAAGVKTLWDERGSLGFDGAGTVALGTTTAFITALLVVNAFMRFVRHRRFTPFVVYRLVLGGVVLACARFAPEWFET